MTETELAREAPVEELSFTENNDMQANQNKTGEAKD